MSRAYAWRWDGAEFTAVALDTEEVLANVDAMHGRWSLDAMGECDTASSPDNAIAKCDAILARWGFACAEEAPPQSVSDAIAVEQRKRCLGLWAS